MLGKALYKDICDKIRFSKIYEKHAQSLSTLFYYKYGASYNPADKVQDAFIKLWENCAKVRPEKAKSFLYTIINNAMLNDFKHQKVVLKHQKSVSSQMDHVTPEFVMRQDEFYARYQTVLSGLKPEERAAFLMNKVEGKTHKEIAALIGVTKKVVEHRIYAAFKKIKDQMDEFKHR